ncbi:MAG: hypothetical protein ACPG42_12340 [Alphaproteobacteria bacterium]
MPERNIGIEHVPVLMMSNRRAEVADWVHHALGRQQARCFADHRT